MTPLPCPNEPRTATTDGDAVRTTLERLREAAKAGENLVASLIEAARARATLGEMTDTLAGVFGRHAGSAMTVGASGDATGSGGSK